MQVFKQIFLEALLSPNCHRALLEITHQMGRSSAE